MDFGGKPCLSSPPNREKGHPWGTPTNILRIPKDRLVRSGTSWKIILLEPTAHRWMADRLAAGLSFLHLPSFDDFDDSYDDLIRTVPAWFGSYLSSFWSGWVFRPSWRSCSTCDLWRFWQRTLWFNVFLQLPFRKSHQQTEKSWSRCPNRGTWRFPQNVNQPVSTNQPITLW